MVQGQQDFGDKDNIRNACLCVLTIIVVQAPTGLSLVSSALQYTEFFPWHPHSVEQGIVLLLSSPQAATCIFMQTIASNLKSIHVGTKADKVPKSQHLKQALR